MPLPHSIRHGIRRYLFSIVELIWEAPAATYARLMAVGDWRSRRCTYRGIRSHPLADPLAALVGRKACLALRAAAENAAVAPIKTVR